MPGRLKNRLEKRCFFIHRFFRLWGIILGGFGTSSWIHVGPKKRGIKGQEPLESQLVMVGGFGQSLERAWAGFWEGLGRFWERSGRIWGGFREGFGTICFWGGPTTRRSCAHAVFGLLVVQIAGSLSAYALLSSSRSKRCAKPWLNDVKILCQY